VLGFTPDADLPALYARATLFVYPSLYEGFGLPPLEALACGTPVVAADNSSLPETLGDAALFLPADAIEQWAATLGRVLADREVSDHLSRLGPPQAARFTWQAAAEKLITAYHLVLGEPGLVD
jgi:glycosyltransferase involved in cell wall biosynthesis